MQYLANISLTVCSRFIFNATVSNRCTMRRASLLYLSLLLIYSVLLLFIPSFLRSFKTFWRYICYRCKNHKIQFRKTINRLCKMYWCPGLRPGLPGVLAAHQRLSNCYRPNYCLILWGPKHLSPRVIHCRRWSRNVCLRTLCLQRRLQRDPLRMSDKPAQLHCDQWSKQRSANVSKPRNILSTVSTQ